MHLNTVINKSVLKTDIIICKLKLAFNSLKKKKKRKQNQSLFFLIFPSDTKDSYWLTLFIISYLSGYTVLIYGEINYVRSNYYYS